MAAVAEAQADIIVATSDNPRTEDPLLIIEDIKQGFPSDSKKSITCEPDRRKAITYAINHASPDDVILIAGKGHEDYQILGTEKTHFDDREEARLALSHKYNQCTS